MKIIGVTGGVGCGKSSVLAELSKILNCRILHADEVAHIVEQPGQDAYNKLRLLLTDEILNEDGSINKPKMAEIIFGDDDLLKKVNDIIHPAVNEYIRKDIENAEREGIYDYYFLEAALLIENGYKAIVDEMWYVYADESVRRERLKVSRGYSDEKITSIMESQLSEEIFRENSDFVIDNSHSIEQSINDIKKWMGL